MASFPRAGTQYQRYPWHLQTDAPTLGGTPANLTPVYAENCLGHRSGGTMKAAAYSTGQTAVNWWQQLRARGNPENQ